jgi:hypothetical protein
MAWERGYYYRVRKVEGRVIREYVGAGRVGELAAQFDALKRAEREEQRACRRAAMAELEALDAKVGVLIELTDLAARSALLAAGYHQHKRGEWRKRRVQGTPSASEPGGSEDRR